MPDKRKQPHLKVINIEKSRDIILETLFPEATLQSVGDKYGMTRERVRQIFKKITGQSPKDMRRQFLIDGDNFKCPICGNPVRPRNPGHNKYCSKACYALTTKYDINTLSECQNCHGTFFPLRNWKSLTKQHSGKYCCTKCFIEDMIKQGKWGRKRPTLLDRIV